MVGLDDRNREHVLPRGDNITVDVQDPPSVVAADPRVQVVSYLLLPVVLIAREVELTEGRHATSANTTRRASVGVATRRDRARTGNTNLPCIHDHPRRKLPAVTVRDPYYSG